MLLRCTRYQTVRGVIDLIVIINSIKWPIFNGREKKTHFRLRFKFILNLELISCDHTTVGNSLFILNLALSIMCYKSWCVIPLILSPCPVSIKHILIPQDNRFFSLQKDIFIAIIANKRPG